LQVAFKNVVSNFPKEVKEKFVAIKHFTVSLLLLYNSGSKRTIRRGKGKSN
jgi:hypothetical protein